MNEFDRIMAIIAGLWKSRDGRKKVEKAAGSAQGGRWLGGVMEKLLGKPGTETEEREAETQEQGPKSFRIPGPEKFHRTPGSSNVWGFAFVPDSSGRKGTLYVTFKRNTFHPGALQRKDQSKVQVHGTRGKAISGKTDSPGASYAYYDVPAYVFQRFTAITGKGAGVFVWDNLRIRGTIYGHKYRYQLVSGSIDTATGGLYVPRRATKAGFKLRSLATAGTGKRGYITSSLAPSKPRSIGKTKLDRMSRHLGQSNVTPNPKFRSGL